MTTRFRLAALSTAIIMGLAACGGGSGSGSGSGGFFLGSNIAIKGTAASGSSLNGVVMIKDSTGKTANTNTDSNGNYQFTTTQLAGMTAPYMLEIDYRIGGVDYYLNSAATDQDLSNGPSTINITPLTDLIVANLAHDIATNVFNNGNFSSILTSAALSAGATALAAQLQPLLTAQGINGTVDLLHQSFTANSGTGLDALLDALQVTVDPATKSAIITNRLNNTSITNSLTGTNTTQISATNNVSLTDLQAITAGFNAFSAEMAKAPSASDPALLAFFDQNHFQQNGQSLALFLQMITTNPTVAGGVMSFSNIVLDPLPTWVTTVPAGATAYKAHFTVMLNNSPNSREEFIIYKSAGGAWLLLGNQKIAKAIMESLETFGFTGNSQTTAYCTGLNPQVAIKGGAAHISYAVITGPGLPASGLLLFNPGANSGNTDFVIAAGDVTTYTGTNTSSMTTNTSSCGFNSLYPLNDSALTSTSAPIVAGAKYTFKLYDDNGTPANRGDDTLLATYNPTLFAAPLLNTQLKPALFPSIGSAYLNQLATVVADANASTVQSFTAHWTSPTAPGLYASNAWINIWSSNSTQDIVSVDLPWNATSATIAIPLLSGTNHVNATLEYKDAGFRNYWSNYGY